MNIDNKSWTLLNTYEKYFLSIYYAIIIILNSCNCIKDLILHVREM